MSDKSFAHFPTLATFKEAPQPVKKNIGKHWMRNSPVAFVIWERLTGHFSWCHVPSHRTLETEPQELQLELIDLQCDMVLKDKFNSLKLDEFYASLSAAKCPNIQKMAQGMLVLFGSTYVCEQTFSVNEHQQRTPQIPDEWWAPQICSENCHNRITTRLRCTG